MEFTQEFIDAFNHAMLYEVGAWHPDDQDVIDGQIETREQRRKVGYVNDPNDRGGETKYGIAVNANPDVDVTNLNLEQAMEIYFNKYWLANKCDCLQYPLNVLHFDGCINHGGTRAIKFLQTSLGIEEPTGNFGPKTEELSANCNLIVVCNKICDIREGFYRRIVQKNPSQQKFLNGWLRRIYEMREYTNKALKG